MDRPDLTPVKSNNIYSTRPTPPHKAWQTANTFAFKATVMIMVFTATITILGLLLTVFPEIPPSLKIRGLSTEQAEERMKDETTTTSLYEQNNQTIVNTTLDSFTAEPLTAQYTILLENGTEIPVEATYDHDTSTLTYKIMEDLPSDK